MITKILIDGIDIMKSWREYFQELLVGREVEDRLKCKVNNKKKSDEGEMKERIVMEDLQRTIRRKNVV